MRWRILILGVAFFDTFVLTSVGVHVHACSVRAHHLRQLAASDPPVSGVCISCIVFPLRGVLHRMQILWAASFKPPVGRPKTAVETFDRACPNEVPASLRTALFVVELVIREGLARLRRDRGVRFQGLLCVSFALP